jgi:hypothetical protein
VPKKQNANPLLLKQAVITDFHEKTNAKAGENYADLTIVAELNPPAAEFLKCSRQVYEENTEVPAHGLNSVTLDRSAYDAVVSIAPEGGTPIEFAAEKVDGFTISPDSDMSLSVKFKVRIGVGKLIDEVEKFFRHYTSTHCVIDIRSPRQEKLFEEPAAGEETEEAPVQTELVEAGEETAEAIDKPKRRKKAAAK